MTVFKNNMENQKIKWIFVFWDRKNRKRKFAILKRWKNGNYKQECSMVYNHYKNQNEVLI